MRLIALLTLLALAVSFCHAQPADEPKEEEETATPSVDMPTILRYPRSIDMMARFWMLLFETCEDAGIKPHDLMVVRPYGSLGIPSHLNDQMKRLYKAEPRPEAAVIIQGTPEHFAKFVETLAPRAGTPHSALAANSAYVVFCYPRAWPRTPTAYRANDLGAGWCVSLIVRTFWIGAPPQCVYDLIKKFPPGQ